MTEASHSTQVLRLGVIGLGRAFTLMLPAFLQDPRVKLVAAADPHALARAQFVRDFAGDAFDDALSVCAHPQVDWVYVATPHQFHTEHALMAIAHGKHVLVEKPMAITLDECTRMVDAARVANVHVVVGHSHSFDLPILRTKALIDSGMYGKARMITAQNFTDFMYRPRRPEELQTGLGGGVIHSQATHQIDIIRLLGGGRVTSVMAHTGNWDATRATEGAYQALLKFDDGLFASATYSGYGHYDSDVQMGHVGELGQAKNPQDYGASRKRLAQTGGAQEEAALKAARNYGGALYTPPALGTSGNRPLHQHFGPITVSCDKADLRPTPAGIEIYADTQMHFEPLPAPTIARSEVIDELYAATFEGRAPLHSGEWARATTEVCLAILASAASGQPQVLRHQVATAP
jgi:phthalate 4,5-cis-dihydrodiol dehydrogenase